jgi:hypothetical protein
MAKWVSFQLEEPRRRGRKTDLWHVWSLRTPPAHLGVVYWFGPWRGYAFYPESQTIFEQDCLRDLAEFVESQTVQHRKGKRAFPPEVTA